MNSEPIRIPAWAASLLALVILPALSSLLTGIDWRTVLLGVIAAVIPLLAVTETVRAFTDSPVTAARKDARRMAALDAIALSPVLTSKIGTTEDDYLDGCDIDFTAAT